MQKPSPELWELSRRLLAACQSASDEHVNVAATVTEKWRASITKFAGAEGFASLMRRALSLASAEMPALQTVNAGADGRLNGFEQMDPTAGSEAAVAITAHLLELLVSFIGEPLTLRLARDAWPDTLLDEHSQKISG